MYPPKMFLKHLSLTNYRSFNRLDMEVPRRLLLLLGDNAQGKTSILEAIYYFATFTSLHTKSDRQMVNFRILDEPLAVARMVVDYERKSRSHRLEARLILEANGKGSTRLRKEILVDGAKRNIYEAVGNFNAVMFLPQMTRIIEGGPDERRKYLNLFISQAQPAYARALSDYSQAIVQRNALLKQLAERGGDRNQLSYWDELVAKNGAVIIQVRILAIKELEYYAKRIHHQLTDSQEIFRLNYQPSCDPVELPEGQYSLPIQAEVNRDGISLEEIYTIFLNRLESLRPEEIARGVTTIGPHRDELRFLSNGIDMGDYGSRGQIRTALLALKLAEVNWLKEKTGDHPVLLLDEVLAELDTNRRADLLHYLDDCEQAIITTTDEQLFPQDFLQQCTIWAVEAGRVKLTER